MKNFFLYISTGSFLYVRGFVSICPRVLFGMSAGSFWYRSAEHRRRTKTDSGKLSLPQ